MKAPNPMSMLPLLEVQGFHLTLVIISLAINNQDLEGKNNQSFIGCYHVLYIVLSEDEWLRLYIYLF